MQQTLTMSFPCNLVQNTQVRESSFHKDVPRNVCVAKPKWRALNLAFVEMMRSPGDFTVKTAKILHSFLQNKQSQTWLNTKDIYLNNKN